MIRTSLQKTSTSALRDLGGFSLIEMMVVIAIIVLMSAIAMPSVSSYFQLSLNSATRDLASTVKETYNSAVITGKVYRIVYSLKENAFWVESGPTTTLLHTKESKEKEESRKKFLSPKEKASKSDFSVESVFNKKKMPLPRGVEFEDVFTEQSNVAITEGTAYTHFFPHGLTEQTIVHLKDSSKHHATLVISPLIGMIDLYDRYVNRDEIFGKQ